MELDQHRVSVKFSRMASRMAVWDLNKLFGFIVTKQGFEQAWVIEECFCSLVEIYEESDIVILVGSGEVPESSQRILTVIEGRSQMVLCEVQFKNTIKAVKSNLIRLVILLEDKIVIMKTENFSITGAFEVSNSMNLLDLSSNIEYCLLAFPNSEEKGYIGIYDCFIGNHIRKINCHKSIIGALALSQDGRLVATASIKGTIIRLFECMSGDLLKQYKRGINSARIFDILFIKNDEKLVISSSTGTIHLFSISSSKGPKTFKNYLSGILPHTYSDHINSIQSSFTFSTYINLRYFIAWQPDNLIIISESSNYILAEIKSTEIIKSEEGNLFISLI